MAMKCLVRSFKVKLLLISWMLLFSFNALAGEGGTEVGNGGDDIPYLYLVAKEEAIKKLENFSAPFSGDEVPTFAQEELLDNKSDLLKVLSNLNYGLKNIGNCAELVLKPVPVLNLNIEACKGRDLGSAIYDWFFAALMITFNGQVEKAQVLAEILNSYDSGQYANVVARCYPDFGNNHYQVLLIKDLEQKTFSLIWKYQGITSGKILGTVLGGMSAKSEFRDGFGNSVSFYFDSGAKSSIDGKFLISELESVPTLFRSEIEVNSCSTNNCKGLEFPLKEFLLCKWLKIIE